MTTHCHPEMRNKGKDFMYRFFLIISFSISKYLFCPVKQGYHFRSHVCISRRLAAAAIA